MGKLIYSVIMSLDGYVSDEAGNFDWAEPDEEVHAFFNALERAIGTSLYGRRMYETMVWWEDPENVADEPAVVREYADIWRAEEKVVYSRTLDAVASAKTRLEREFDAEAVRAIKARTEREIAIGGAELAGQALRAGLVDECLLFLAPVVIGAGHRALPERLRLDLQLIEERPFAGGMTFLRYGVRN